MSELLRVENLCRFYRVGSNLTGGQGTVKAVDGVSFSVERGETLGLVGETGCGKSTIGRILVGLDAPTSGKVLLSKRVNSSNPVPLIRQMIFQDPYASLDPRFTAAQIIAEPLTARGLFPVQKDRENRIAELLYLVGLDRNAAYRYPHEFSGGQRQRIGIARALAAEPDLIVCDEPLASLDVSVQAQIVVLLKTLQERAGLTYVFIAHDLAMIRHICRKVLIMYLGSIVESGPTDALFAEPLHPYTCALLAAAPIPNPRVEHLRVRIPLHGEIPSPLAPPIGCKFHTRCPQAMPICQESPPDWKDFGQGRRTACHLYNCR